MVWLRRPLDYEGRLVPNAVWLRRPSGYEGRLVTQAVWLRKRTPLKFRSSLLSLLPALFLPILTSFLSPTHRSLLASTLSWTLPLSQSLPSSASSSLSTFCFPWNYNERVHIICHRRSIKKAIQTGEPSEEHV